LDLFKGERPSGGDILPALSAVDVLEKLSSRMGLYGLLVLGHPLRN